MEYHIHFDFADMVDRLAESERNGQLRLLKASGLHQAVGIGNMVRMAAGLGMKKGPRHLQVNDRFHMGEDGVVMIQIIRVERAR